jgi:hypothetical protein
MRETLQDKVDTIRALYEHDPEAAHGMEDDLVAVYLNQRASFDDQDALILTSLVNDRSLTRWYA